MTTTSARLYRSDSFLREFSARVIETLTYEDHPALVLDQTAFYPTAGGQPNDVGHINDLIVSNVVERADGTIVHVLATAGTITTGAAVAGRIDWPRRHDHMQQHSGQHVLSQAFVQMADLETVAVHIGTEECTLDLVTKSLSADVIDKVENEANRIIYENRPFRVYEVAFDALQTVPLRKPPKKSENGLVRIVEIADYDWSACGGTHVRGTAEIGLIKIIKVEKRGTESRVGFRCGRRALQDYQRLNKDVNLLAEGFTVARYELPQTVQRLRDEAKTTRKALDEAQQRLLDYEVAQILASTAPSAQGVKVIVRAYPDRDMNALRMMAKKLSAQENVVALLGGSGATMAGATMAGAKSALCFARSANLKLDVAALLREALTQLVPGGAKGGGSPDFAQGGGPEVSLEHLSEILNQVQAAANL